MHRLLYNVKLPVLLLLCLFGISNSIHAQTVISSVDLEKYAQVEEGIVVDSSNIYLKTMMEPINIELENVSFEKAIKQIISGSKLKLFYTGSLKPEKENISISFENEKRADVLAVVLKEVGMKYSISTTGHLILTSEETILQDVRGQITDVEGEPLVGVSIMVKGTSRGTTTDRDGNYSLEVPDSENILVISYIGFLTQEISIDGREVIDIVLEQDTYSLEEMVVVGYGEQKRSNVTGTISSVDMKDLNNKPQLRLDEALQGMAAGVTVTQNGGAPGAAPTIHIRGVGSISNTEPLWIVDGIRMETGNHLNINDIESVEVLKDAASSSIYGARAAHGVILVTTKRGEGETVVKLSSSIGQRSPVSLPELLNSEDFVYYKRESRLNAGQNPEPAWDNWEHDTDWIDAYYSGSGVISSNNLSISRGDDIFNYYMSLGYDDETGILIDNTFNRLNGRINADIKLADWLKVGTSILLSKVDENPINNFNENTTGAIPFRSIPIMPIRDESNPYGGWGRGPVYFQGPNPVASHLQQHENRNNKRMDGNLFAELSPLKGLSVKGTIGYNTLTFTGERFDESFDYGAFSNTINSLTYNNAEHQSLSGSITATFSHSFGNHNIHLLGGYEATQYDLQQFNVSGTDFPLDVAWSMNLATGSFNTTERFNVYQSRTLSQFGRFSYNYDERYLLETNIRRDASAPKFGPANIWGIFPSFSAGWNVYNESFFPKIPYLTTLRLKGSTGRLGSDNIGDYIYLRTYTSQFTSYAFDENGQNRVGGFYVSKFPNEEVKWEEVYMHNIGIELGAFSNRLTVGVDYYIKDTKDLLYGVPIPASVGISTHNFDAVNPELNIGTLRNTGVDIQVGYKTNFRKFAFDISGNTSFLKNRMGSLAHGQYIIGGQGGGQIGGMTRTQPGMPISSFYGFQVRQILNSSDDVFAVNSWAPDGTYQEAGTAAGDFMYYDLNGPGGETDGQVTAEHDRTFIGNPWPKVTYAMNINANYNNLIDISLQFQGVYGVDIFNADKAYTRNFFGDNNTTPLISEAWTAENHTDHPRNIANDPNGNFSKPSDYFVEDGSYLKLRNIQIGINVPARYLEMVGLGSVRIFANANNVLTFTRYSGLDPEIGGSNISRGIDYGLYPQVRTITIGTEVQF